MFCAYSSLSNDLKVYTSCGHISVSNITKMYIQRMVVSVKHTVKFKCLVNTFLSLIFAMFIFHMDSLSVAPTECTLHRDSLPSVI